VRRFLLIKGVKGRYFNFMMLNSQKESDIDQIIDRAIEQNPHSKDILKAFQPIIAKQTNLVASAEFKKLDYSAIDQEKLKAGVPVIKQLNLFSPEQSELLKKIVLALACAVKDGLPAMAEGIDKLAGLIQKDKLNPSDYFQAYPDTENRVIKHWVEELKITEATGLFLFSLVARVVLESRAKEISAYLGEIQWVKGYCPICGELPTIALIQEEGGKRFLHCSSCNHDWRFTRVVCPYCENEAQQGMDYFYIEKKTQESAFVCDKCKKYLVTLYRAGSLFVRDMDIAAINLIHLDMIMQDKGYEPMASRVWNILK
jgi:FdhE protein